MWWDKYRRIPFADVGRDWSACDCWGIICLIYWEELGIKLEGYEAAYSDTTERKTLAHIVSAEHQKNWRDLEPGEKPQPFDVIILKIGGIASHVGIVTKPGSMLHCSKDVNTVHEPYTRLQWKDRIMGFARYVGTAEGLRIPRAV